MSIDLEKIDLIRNRTGVSYRDAKKALDEAGGDVIEALIALEESDRSFTGTNDAEEFTEKIQGSAQDIMEQIKSALQRGQDAKIKVKQGERVVFELPAAFGALGVLAMLAKSELAILGALGTTTAMAKNYTLEIEHGPQKGTEQSDTAVLSDILGVKK